MTPIYGNFFIDHVRYGRVVSKFIEAHGYFRINAGYNVAFYPNNPDEKYHALGLTPGLNQTPTVIARDVAKNRILLVAEGINSSGDYVIIEDDTNWMTLSGNLTVDLRIYCMRLARALGHVTNSAKSLGLTPHDFIAKIAD
jgi:hypothetical protein